MIDKNIQNTCTDVYTNVRKWIDKIYDIDINNMQGACAIASYTLYRSLKKKGYSADFVLAWNEDAYEGHAWIEINNYVIDLTYKQFNYIFENDILIIKKEEYSRNIPTINNFNIIYKNRKAIKEVKTWTKNQNPFNYLRQINSYLRKIN